MPYVESHKSYGVAANRNDVLLPRRTPRTPVTRVGPGGTANAGSPSPGAHGSDDGSQSSPDPYANPRGTPGADAGAGKHKRPASKRQHAMQHAIAWDPVATGYGLHDHVRADMPCDALRCRRVVFWAVGRQFDRVVLCFGGVCLCVGFAHIVG